LEQQLLEEISDEEKDEVKDESSSVPTGSTVLKQGVQVLYDCG
jgi:hypothetical protein